MLVKSQMEDGSEKKAILGNTEVLQSVVDAQLVQEWMGMLAQQGAWERDHKQAKREP